MSTTTITKYRIYCNTEANWIEGWGVTSPTVCYNNNTHNVNESSSQILESISTNQVIVQEENIPTNGNIKLDCHTFDIPVGASGSITNYESTYPHPINMISLTFCPSQDNIGDTIIADVGHHTTIGYLTENISSGITGGITGFSVSQTVIDYLNLGYLVTLNNGITSCEMGRCVMIDSTNNRISTEFATNTNFSVSSPTYVQQTVEMVKNLHFPYSTIPIDIGDDKIGSSYVPTNVIGRIRYTNNNGLAKKFTFYMEYLY